MMFFKTYTEKVWSIPCNQIRADWAAQRIQNMSLKRVVLNSVLGTHNAKSLIQEFDYPRFGPGMMWERCQQLLEDQDSPIHLNTKVIQVEHKDNRVTKIIAQQGDYHTGTLCDRTIEYKGDHFINSMPISALVHRLNPLPPQEVLEAAQGLKYRDFLIVSLIINREHIFPDNWLYIHSPEFKVGRIQNFKNWSPQMVPDASKTCLGMEYFCSQGDSLWEMEDSDLIELASAELVKLNLSVKPSEIEDGCIIRQLKAYPVYDGEYRGHLQVLQDYLRNFENLQSVGRNGMHRYNNQDHSMLTAILAARNIAGEKHDLWNVNVERSYHENFTAREWSQLKQQQSKNHNDLQSLSSVSFDK